MSCVAAGVPETEPENAGRNIGDDGRRRRSRVYMSFEREGVVCLPNLHSSGSSKLEDAARGSGHW